MTRFCSILIHRSCLTTVYRQWRRNDVSAEKTLFYTLFDIFSVACNFAIFKNKAFHDIFSMAQNNFEIVFFISLFLVFFISKFLSLTTKLWYSRTLRCLINRPEAA